MRGSKTKELWENPEYRENMSKLMTKINIDENRLSLLYKYGLTVPQLSKYFDCGNNTIYKRLKKTGTELRHFPQKGRIIIASWKGYKHTEKYKENKRKSQLGSKNSMYGKIPHNKGKKATMKQRINQSLGHTGKTKFDGFTSTLMENIRHSGEYQNWKIKIFIRDNRLCKMCNKKQKNIVAHHIKKLSTIVANNNINTLDLAYDCKEIWDINNGITLCEKCHNEIERKEEQYKEEFRNIIKVINNENIYKN